MGGVRSALESGQLQTVEYEVDDMGVRHTYEARIVPCGPDQVLSVVRDITPLKETEYLKNAFIVAVDHELRSPLTAIQGAIQLLQSGASGGMTPETRQLVEIVSDNALRLGQLIDDVLDLERMESGVAPGPMRSMDLLPLIQEAIHRQSSAATRRRIVLQFRLEGGRFSTWGDPDRLSRVLQILLSNAIKFSESGGEVELRLLQSGSWIRVEVEDHGPGIPGTFQDRIFQPFQQANAHRRGGMGLGLALARHIIERHGGRIGFLSQTNRGAIFFFTLPIAAHQRSSSTLP